MRKLWWTAVLAATMVAATVAVSQLMNSLGTVDAN
jgi:hypothetical protein